MMYHLMNFLEADVSSVIDSHVIAETTNTHDKHNCNRPTVGDVADSDRMHQKLAEPRQMICSTSRQID